IEAREVGRLVRPAERREWPEPGGEPRVEHIGVLLDGRAALRAGPGVLAVGPLMSVRAREHRDAMAPPQLPRDVPVADARHPVLERRPPPLRNDPKLAAMKRREHRFGERLHFHEPLVAEAGLDHRITPITAAHGVLVLLGFDEETFALELLDDLFSSFESIKTIEIRRHSGG